MTCAENVQRKNTKQAQNKYVSYISGLGTLDSTVGYSGKTTIVRVYDDNFEKKMMILPESAEFTEAL